MRFFTRLSSLLAMSLGASMLVVSASQVIVPLVMAAGGLALLHRWPRLALHRLDMVVLLALTFFGLSGVVMGVWHDELAGMLQIVWPALMAMPALALLLLYPPRLGWLWGGLAIGGMSAGTWALWQKIAHGVDRAAGHVPLNAILFGNLSLLLGVMCLAGVGWSLTRRRGIEWATFLLCGASGGVLASLLSGSRGGWVALPLILLVLHRGYGCDLPVRWNLGLPILVCILAAGSYFVPSMGVQARVDQAVGGVVDYLAGADRLTSVSARVDMWRTAAELILERPLDGHGTGGYRLAIASSIDRGEIDPELGQFWHAHNDLLDAWAKRGLPGLMALVVLYVTPIMIFGRRLRDANLARRSLAVAGLMLPVAFIDFGMTYSFMAYPIGVAVYSCWLAVLWSAWRVMDTKGDEK